MYILFTLDQYDQKQNQTKNSPKSAVSATTLCPSPPPLTSTTYGFLTLDPPPPPPAAPPPRLKLGSLLSTPLSEPDPDPETINSWDLMAGLVDSDNAPSFRFSTPKPSETPNLVISDNYASLKSFLDGFETICPPNGGENKVVLYSTSLRGVRKTFEECNSVRSAIQGLGISVSERDISMDRGFRDELTELMKKTTKNKNRKGAESSNVVETTPPRLFVKGRYIGGFEEVMKIVEEGYIGKLLEGLPMIKGGYNNVCEGCGGVGFLPCFTCYGSCKMTVIINEQVNKKKKKNKSVVVKCSDCNENGLVICPICA
ncbi:hypothetical protein MIMGU_mgv1a022765mg [Erythranthe guttata]|uniref:Glutaredoxin domain-containing protein n=1 Tax=Erythranthe guttata TaxID=4155 RepID=A0A022QW64_ERYGU|nr:hypothetical protein MIMGU_mgv1a022765mg [Erythranthe guttata]